MERYPDMNDSLSNSQPTPNKMHNQTTLVIGPDGQTTVYGPGQPRPPGRWEGANRDPYSWLRQGNINDLAQLAPRARPVIAQYLTEITNKLDYDYKSPSEISTWIWKPRPPRALLVTLAETTAFIDEAVTAFRLREQEKQNALMASLRARVNLVPPPSTALSQLHNAPLLPTKLPHRQPTEPTNFSNTPDSQIPASSNSVIYGGNGIPAGLITSRQCMHNGQWHQNLAGGYCMNHGLLFMDVDFIYWCEQCGTTWCRYCCRMHGKELIDYA